MRERNQFNKIVELIESYNNQQPPLHRFLKEYFRNQREMGSRDRKLYTDWVYNFFRVGKTLTNQKTETKIVVANFLLYSVTNDLLDYALTNYTSLRSVDVDQSLKNKIDLAGTHYSFSTEDIFPLKDLVSINLDFHEFTWSLLQQPKLWIRIRKEFLDEVKQELNQLRIPFEQSLKHSLACSIPQRTKLDSIKSFQNGYFEIQDLSSQLTGKFFEPQPGEHWYDCCAASGGKSLLLHSIEPTVKLTVSDKRDTILKNLDFRFQKVGIKNYQSFVASMDRDLPAELQGKIFDGIILDAPCTGSGTWARTPEQLNSFQPEKIKYYKKLQRSILKNVARFLKTGKPLIYITCSVFKEENEEIVEFAKHLGLVVEKQQLIQSSEEGGDTMFVCRLVKA